MRMLDAFLPRRFLHLCFCCFKRLFVVVVSGALAVSISTLAFRPPASKPYPSPGLLEIRLSLFDGGVDRFDVARKIAAVKRQTGQPILFNVSATVTPPSD